MDTPPVIPDFELLRCIGGGSYGDVWLGRSVTGIYRAVKIVDRSRFADERPFLREFDGIMRFQKAVGNQARQLALLHVGKNEDAGLLYYVMELADDALAGTDIDPATYVPLTLKELRLRRGLIPTTECVQIGTELASALLGLHVAGLIHRDVKPSNIIFVNRQAKLADVGLIASSEHTLTSIGTPGYAPPEGSGTASADIYSLGKILYELSTGLGPEEFPRLPPEILTAPDTRPFFELNEVILRACAPDPVQRYHSAREMLDELRLLQAGRSVKELNRMRRAIRRLVRVGGFAMAIAAAVVAALAFKNYFAMKRIAEQETALSSQARASERLARYTSGLHLAQLALSRDDYGAARAALRPAIPAPGQEDIRGFEWYALWNEMTGDQADVFGQPGGPPVSALAVSPDNSLVAVQTGGASGNTVLWDRINHRARILAKDTSRLGSFSPDGRRLTVGTGDYKIHEVDLATGGSLPPLPPEGFFIQGLPDGRTLLLLESKTDDAGLFIWDQVEQRKTGEWHYQGAGKNVTLSAAALSSDGRWLAASVFWAEGIIRKREIVVSDVTTGSVQFRTSTLPQVRALAFSPDGLRLAAALPGPVAVMDTRTGAEIFQLNGHIGNVNAVKFSADGRLLSTGGSDQTVRIWNLDTGRSQSILRGHEAGVSAIGWLNGGQELISGGEDGTWRQWATSAKKPSRIIRSLWGEAFGDFVFSPSGTTIAATDSSGGIVSLDSASLQPLGAVKGAFEPLAFAPDETLLALSADQKLMRCNLSTGITEAQELHLNGTGKLVAIRTSVSGSRSAFVYEDKHIEIWDLTTGTAIGTLLFPGGKIGTVALSDQSPEIAVGDRSGNLFIYSLPGCALKERLPLQASAIYSLAYSGDGKWLAIGRADGQVAVWNRAAHHMETEFPAHGAEINFLTFSPDGSRLITAGRDSNILIWTVGTFRQIAAWRWERDGAESNFIASIKFDRNAQQLGVCTEKGKLRIWDLRH